MSLEGFTKNLDRVNVPDVGRNEVIQIFGPQAENARFPNWVRVLTTTAALVVEERSCRRPDS